MTHQPTNFGDLRLLAGQLCLDFVNTIENRAGARPEELLHSYPDLIKWGRHADLLSDTEMGQLTERANRDEVAAQRILDDALGLREALHRVFLAVARQDSPVAADLERVQQHYVRAMEHAQLAPADGSFTWVWPSDSASLDRLLWPIVLSATELLTTGDPRRIKVCANPHGCGWLFYDSSKNASRRWCSMEGCGSQIKMRRHYAKRRAAHSI